jgi:curved DNA-binding protein CbpA
VRIPLDYYRILGIPAQTDLTQLEQAYRDRLQQLPQREYSDLAIASRKELITVAYQVLSDPIRRAEYDNSFLAPPPENIVDAEAESTPNNILHFPITRPPELEITPEHFLGALLILFEQGEYEEITSICFPYIGNNGNSNNSGSLISLNFERENEIDREELTLELLREIEPDVTLTFALAAIELGAREWRDRNYEEASHRYEIALRILAQADLFSQLQETILKNLDKLRPYRVLHLVSLPEDCLDLRQKGLNLLSEMMSVCCNDKRVCKARFGLSVEGTIKFIDQIRPYLTVAEQQHLFSQVNANAQSDICIFLYVYSLLARGFAYRNPQSILTASQILRHRLNQHPNILIEQAICALLLGQTVEADRLLAAIPDSKESIVIRQQSQGAADLLPGLCWYIQNEWLPNQVFPCFRDLQDASTSLDTYFQDPYVVTVLEHPANNMGGNSWASHKPQLIDVPNSGDLSPVENLLSPTNSISRSLSDYGDLNYSLNRGELYPIWQSSTPPSLDGNIPVAERVNQAPPPPPVMLPEGISSQTEEVAPDNVIDLNRERERRHRSSTSAPTANTMMAQSHAPLVDASTSSLVPTKTGGKTQVNRDRTGKLARRRRRRKLNVNVSRLVIVGAGAIAVTSAGVFLTKTTWNWVETAFNSSTSTPQSGNGGGIGLPPPPSPKDGNQPTEKPKASSSAGLLTPASGQQLISSWLTAKAQSLGKEYQTAKLAEVLAEPALSRSVERANSEKAQGAYWAYKHPQVKVESVAHVNPQANSAALIALVQEEAQYYQNDRLNSDRSYNKNLRVKYDLIRKADRWYIKDMSVIN